MKPIVNPIDVRSDSYILADRHASLSSSRRHIMPLRFSALHPQIETSFSSVMPMQGPSQIRPVQRLKGVGRPSQVTIPRIRSHLICTSHFFSDSSIYVFSTPPAPPTSLTIRKLPSVDPVPVLPTSQLTPGQSSPSQLNTADAFLAPLRSDHPMDSSPLWFLLSLKVVALLVWYISLVDQSSDVVYAQEKEFITLGGTASG